MKKTSVTLLFAVTTLTFFYLLICTAAFSFSKDKYPQADSIFIGTHWQQMGGFEQLTPDHMRLGCWSTALAQIMYHHRLKPFGMVSYTSSKGYRINEMIDSTRINFNQTADRMNSATPPDVAAMMALYNYDAALAVKKDFGTDNYMQKLAPASLFEAHYRVKASRYISWQGLMPYTHGKLERIIMAEISSKRPLFLHFANLKNFGHSVVIDGYKHKGKQFFVHLNQGQGGPQDGWYNFGTDLLAPGDSKLRVIYTFKPITNDY